MSVVPRKRTKTAGLSDSSECGCSRIRFLGNLKSQRSRGSLSFSRPWKINRRSSEIKTETPQMVLGIGSAALAVLRESNICTTSRSETHTFHDYNYPCCRASVKTLENLADNDIYKTTDLYTKVGLHGIIRSLWDDHSPIPVPPFQSSSVQDGICAL